MKEINTNCSLQRALSFVNEVSELSAPAVQSVFDRCKHIRFGEFLADNIVRFINLFTYLLTYSGNLCSST